ncbi:MAG: hypothetical protein Q4F77_10215 [Acinetobacter sp.]|uniref:DUF6587 family protein n=1 Tax=Acinetobacter sp. TaxID=472 RepID=UPI0026E06442|nr:DUF6587 family protein [Acinetobacter sp.]MDO5543667.1 hypothetical protein [Acinetobacter sp.]
MVEILIVASLVLWSTVVVFKKVFPKTSGAVFLKLSNFCTEKGWQGLAKWLKPAAAAGCGGSCGCDSQDQPAEKKVEVQAVKWK